jgi:uncharacterized membrane protein
MKGTLIGGLLLAILGIFVLVKSPGLTTRRDVLRVGDLKVSADEQQSMPPWLGGLLIASGVVVVVVGMRSGKTR